jgi:hypothetical protein
MVGVGRASSSFTGHRPDVGPLLFSDRTHATPSTRRRTAATDGVALAGEIATEL